MAKSRVTINPMYTGGAGGYSFYVRGGEQVVRQRRNNSNYGESASRSYAQMIRRIKWGNLVNIFKAIKSWQPKAYDSKAIGVTDYNMFMKLNVNRASVGTSKQANEQGMAVWENYQVSNGSLPSISYSLDTGANLYVTDINFTQAITAAMTVGEFAAEIIASNPRFKANDNIAFVFVKNHQYIGVEFPYAYSDYTEITLDVTSSRLLADVSIIGERLTETAADKLAVTYTAIPSGGAAEIEGIAIIHTRKDSGSLVVSSQSVLMTTDQFIQLYSGEEWYQHCIESYGLDTEVPLDPNFNEGVITRVTANGAVLANAAVLTGSQSVRVYGNSLYGQGYRFVHNGVDYTPLTSTDNYDEYILTANGSYVIYVGSHVYMSFTISGISIPAPLSGAVNAYIQDDGGNLMPGGSGSASDYCLNLPIALTSVYDNIRIQVFYDEGEQGAESDYTVVNGEITRFTPVSQYHFDEIIIAATDLNSPVIVYFDDFIIFVGNYTD